jgi:hypothetical protein
VPVTVTYLVAMERPTRFEHNRYVGDKRTQVVYDLDTVPEEIMDELLAARTYQSFGPDTLTEAANRGYKPHRSAMAPTEEP